MAAGSSTSWLNTVTLSEFTDNVTKDFSLFNDRVKPAASQLFIYENLEAHTGNTRRYDEVDVETFASDKPEGTDAVKARAGRGYTMTMEAVRRAKEIEISWEMRRYNKAPQVVSQLTSLNWFVPQRMDIDLTHRLTFATSSSYTDMDGNSVTVTVGDGNPLAYATHALAFSSTTYRNRVSGDPVFSQGALESAELLGATNVYSNFGEKRVMDFNVIFTSDDPGTIRDVRQVLESTADVDAAHSGVLNTYRGKYRHVVLPWLATTATGAADSAKRQWWGIAAIGMGASGWQAYYGVFEPTNLKAPTEDEHNDDWLYGTRGSYGIVVLSGRGLVMSNPVS